MKIYKYLIINMILMITVVLSNSISSINEVGEGSFLFKNEDTEGNYQFLPQLDTKVTINIKGMVSSLRTTKAIGSNTKATST